MLGEQARDPLLALAVLRTDEAVRVDLDEPGLPVTEDLRDLLCEATRERGLPGARRPGEQCQPVQRGGVEGQVGAKFSPSDGGPDGLLLDVGVDDDRLPRRRRPVRTKRGPRAVVGDSVGET